jgi:phenylacetate-coenzyme A ligase PaaK-like adenylate-forming protein
MEGVTAVHIVGRSEDNVISIHSSDVHFYPDQVSPTGASPIMVRGKSTVTITAVAAPTYLRLRTMQW